MARSILVEYQKAFHEKGMILTMLGVFLINAMNLLDEMHLYPTRESASVLYFWVNRHILGAFSIMIFLLCGLSYGIQFCQERNTGNWKYYLMRENPYRYGISKIVVTVTTAMFSCVMGYLLLWIFLACKHMVFPEDTMFFEQLVDGVPFARMAMQKKCSFFVLNIIPEVMTFTFLAMFSLMISVYSRSKYVVLAAPLLIYYGWNYLTGLLRLPEIFQWPLTTATGFQCMEGDTQNLIFTMGYYVVGIIIMGIIFLKKLKGEMENV